MNFFVYIFVFCIRFAATIRTKATNVIEECAGECTSNFKKMEGKKNDIVYVWLLLIFVLVSVIVFFLPLSLSWILGFVCDVIRSIYFGIYFLRSHVVQQVGRHAANILYPFDWRNQQTNKKAASTHTQFSKNTNIIGYATTFRFNCLFFLLSVLFQLFLPHKNHHQHTPSQSKYYKR